MSANSKILAEKLRENALRLRVRQKFDGELREWLPVYKYLLQHHIHHRIEYLAAIKEEERPYWERAIRGVQDEYPQLSESQFIVAEANPAHVAVLDYFPNTHPLRYVPDLPVVFRFEGDLQKAMNTCRSFLHDVSEVFLFYEQYTPLLRIGLDDLCKHAAHLMEPLDNVFVTSPDYRFLIFKSLEDEWRAGRCKSDVASL